MLSVKYLSFDEFPIEIYEIIINQLCFSRYVENLAKLNKQFASLFTSICQNIRSKELRNTVFSSIPFFPKKEKERTRDQDRETIPLDYEKNIYIDGEKIGQINWHWGIPSIFLTDCHWTVWCTVSKELLSEIKEQNEGGLPSNNHMVQEITAATKTPFFVAKRLFGWKRNTKFNGDYVNLAAIETEFWKVWSIINRA